MTTEVQDVGEPSFAEDETSHFSILLNLFRSSALVEYIVEYDQPVPEEGFEQHRLKSQNSLSEAIFVLDGIDKSLIIPKEVVVHGVLLCGEHSEIELWSNYQCVSFAEQLLTRILERCHCPSLLSLLLHFQVDSFLCALRPKLLKSSWKNHPAAVSCFIWILINLKSPHLADHLNTVLPTCLLLVDDFVYSNKVKGLQCLQHVSNNVSYSELNQHGRGTVIYNAVQHMIYFRETEIIPPLTSCLIALLTKTEHDSLNTLSWSRFDDVLNIWIPSMEMEQKLLLRAIFIDSLNELLQAMGLASVRWSNKLLNIFSEYCEQDGTQDKSLISMLSFINGTWPRISSNFQSIVMILMKVTINVTRKNTASKDSTLKLIKQCFDSLEKVCKTKYSTFINELKYNNDMNQFYLLIIENKIC